MPVLFADANIGETFVLIIFDAPIYEQLCKEYVETTRNSANMV